MVICQSFSCGNIFQDIPVAGPDEILEKILESKGVRIERIISNGQATPEGRWYDQDLDEWVVLLKGRAGILIEGENDPRLLKAGDYIHFPARIRHRVEWTSPEETCIWLAIHFQR